MYVGWLGDSVHVCGCSLRAWTNLMGLHFLPLLPSFGTDGKHGARARVSTNTHNNLTSLTRLAGFFRGWHTAMREGSGTALCSLAAWRERDVPTKCIPPWS